MLTLPGADCRDQFRAAYLNRYTWPFDFSGYKGVCIFSDLKNKTTGSFNLDKDLKVNVNEIRDPNIIKSIKSIKSQLYEVAIHKVKRSFEDVHGQNIFSAGDAN